MSSSVIDQQKLESKEQKPDFSAWRKMIAQLPLTLRPAIHQQLGEWDLLFPFEQNRLRSFFAGLESFSPAERAALAAPLNAIEAKMGVAGWHFSEMTDTIENASLLARSEYYREWRRQVQQVFDAIDARTPQPNQKFHGGRLVVLMLPESLPVDPNTAWEPWKPQAHVIKVTEGGTKELSELLRKGEAGCPGIPDLFVSQNADPADLWLIDAENYLCGSAVFESPSVASLSYTRIKPFRDKFLAGLNTIPREIAVADQTSAVLRQADWTKWCPPELVQQRRLQNFVIDLFLSGNGALIFSNAFVEWAASEAFRRARPRAVIACFGLRNKPKLFTSIAVFENQEKISTIPDVADPENSAVDAAILAHYVWLAARRYTEFEQSACCCISEHLNAMSVIAPPGTPIEKLGDSASPQEIHHAINAWLEQNQGCCVRSGKS